EGPERVAVLFRRFFPVGPDRGPAVAESLLISISVLRDDRGNTFRMAERKSEARRCPVIKYINAVPLEPNTFRQPLNDACEIVEGVGELAARRHTGLAKAWKIRSDHVKSIGQQRN